MDEREPDSAPTSFVDLLYADAPREAYDDLLARLGGAENAEAGERHARALQLRERLARHRGREAELAALYETATDLTRMRDLDMASIFAGVLAAKETSRSSLRHDRVVTLKVDA